MKCQTLFSGKIKKNIAKLMSAEFLQQVLKFKCRQQTIQDCAGLQVGFASSLPMYGKEFSPFP